MKEFYYDSKYRKAINHQHQTRRRQQGRYTTPKISNNYEMRILEYTIPRLLNLLPTHLLDIKSEILLKKRLKQYFLELQE